MKTLGMPGSTAPTTTTTSNTTTTVVTTTTTTVTTTTTIGTIATSTAPRSPYYHGGAIVHDPLVDIVVWGPNYQPNILQRVQAMLASAAGSAAGSLLTQYYDTVGHIHNDLRLGATWIDPVFTPVATDPIAEISKAVALNHWTVDGATIFLVLLPFEVSLGVASEQPCGFHGSGVHGTSATFGPPIYAVVQYPAPSSGCEFSTGPEDSVTFAAWHELSEAITDPFDSGWYDFASPLGKSDSVINEVADVCMPSGTVPLTAMLPLRSGGQALIPLVFNAADGTCRGGSG